MGCCLSKKGARADDNQPVAASPPGQAVQDKGADASSVRNPAPNEAQTAALASQIAQALADISHPDEAGNVAVNPREASAENYTLPATVFQPQQPAAGAETCQVEHAEEAGGKGKSSSSSSSSSSANRQNK